MSDIILSLDIGTSKIAAIAWNCSNKETLDIVSAVNDSTLAGLPSKYHEQDPDCVYRICSELLMKLIENGTFSATDVKTIAISGQMHGVLLANKQLRPLSNLMTWCDQRSAKLVASINRANWPVERTGCYLHAGYGGATLAMLVSEQGIPAGAIALTIADYVAARLCGVIGIDASHAASWGIMDVKNKCWDRELIDRLGIPFDVLPEIRSDLFELGNVTADIRLPGNVSVRLPIGDNQASFFGTCGLANDAVLLNLGTGGQISLPSPEFDFKLELETRPLPFGGYLQVGASLCGGRSYAHLKDFFKQALMSFSGQEFDDGELYRIMDSMAGDAETELAVDTRFAGTRLDTGLSGSIKGIKTDNFTPGALCRGFTRGMIRELTGMVDRSAVEKFNRVMISGNGIRKNPLAQQFIMEELGISCVSVKSKEEAAVGAAMAAAKAGGLL